MRFSIDLIKRIGGVTRSCKMFACFETMPDICHGHLGWCPRRKNLSCGEISNFCIWQMWRNIKFLHVWINFTFLHLTDVEKSEISFIMCTIYGDLLHFTLFCCKICLFFAIYAVLSQNRFVAIYALLSGENLAKNSGRGEKLQISLWNHLSPFLWHLPVQRALGKGWKNNAVSDGCSTVAESVWMDWMDLWVGWGMSILRHSSY